MPVPKFKKFRAIFPYCPLVSMEKNLLDISINRSETTNHANTTKKQKQQRRPVTKSHCYSLLRYRIKRYTCKHSTSASTNSSSIHQYTHAITSYEKTERDFDNCGRRRCSYGWCFTVSRLSLSLWCACLSPSLFQRYICFICSTYTPTHTYTHTHTLVQRPCAVLLLRRPKNCRKKRRRKKNFKTYVAWSKQSRHLLPVSAQTS